MAARDPEEMFHEAQAWRVPLGLVPTLAQIPTLPPHRERGFFTSIEVDGRQIEIPGVPHRSNLTTTQVTRPPRLGEHNPEVYGNELGISDERLRGLADRGVV